MYVCVNMRWNQILLRVALQFCHSYYFIFTKLWSFEFWPPVFKFAAITLWLVTQHNRKALNTLIISYTTSVHICWLVVRYPRAIFTLKYYNSLNEVFVKFRNDFRVRELRIFWYWAQNRRRTDWTNIRPNEVAKYSTFKIRIWDVAK